MDIENDLINFGKMWDDSMVSNIADDIGKFMSDDWVIVGTDGGITPKTNFLKWIRSGDLHHTRMDSDDVRIKIYGNTGVITARETSAGIYKGEPFSFYEWSTSVFIYESEKWICVLTMLTPAKAELASDR